MSVQALKKRQDHEIQILKAIYALNNNDFKSINAAADFFEIPRCTLHRRRNGGSSQARSHKTVQFLTNAGEITLVRWIKRYTISGTQLNNKLLKELAISIRAARITHASSSTPPPVQLNSINNKWIQRFRNRHSEIRAIYARQLEWSRKIGASFANVGRWFDAVALMYEQHSYDPSNIWNMDESGFGIGEEQSMKVLVYLDRPTKHRVIAGKQEWVTDIECISAAGEALAPLLIFKGSDINTR
jgi:hypothetical protein